MTEYMNDKNVNFNDWLEVKKIEEYIRKNQDKNIGEYED